MKILLATRSSLVKDAGKGRTIHRRRREKKYWAKFIAEIALKTKSSRRVESLDIDAPKSAEVVVGVNDAASRS